LPLNGALVALGGLVKSSLLLFVLICSSAEACRLERLDYPEYVDKADFIVIAEIVNNTQNENMENSENLDYFLIEVLIKNKEVIKGGGSPPSKIFLAGCGFGSEVGTTSLILINKVGDKWVGKASPKSIFGEHFPDYVQSIKSMATNKPLKQDF